MYIYIYRDIYTYKEIKFKSINIKLYYTHAPGCVRENGNNKKKEVARNSMHGTLKMHWNSCKMGCQMASKVFVRLCKFDLVAQSLRGIFFGGPICFRHEWAINYYCMSRLPMGLIKCTKDG